MKNCWFPFGILLFIIACAIPQKTVNNENKLDKNEPEYKLEEARITLSTGDFNGAEDLYLDIFNDSTFTDSIRQQALFNLGMMYSDAASTIEDYNISLEYLRLLLREFPKTQFKEQTNREIRYIRNQIKRLKL